MPFQQSLVSTVYFKTQIRGAFVCLCVCGFARVCLCVSVSASRLGPIHHLTLVSTTSHLSREMTGMCSTPAPLSLPTALRDSQCHVASSLDLMPHSMLTLGAARCSSSPRAGIVLVYNLRGSKEALNPNNIIVLAARGASVRGKH